MSAPRIRAPELPDTLEWFNTTNGPIKLADCRGKIVLLHFWTYCCINCHHVLPELAELERRYPDNLVVIGIHSPKFPNERIGDNVQKAINRHYVRHPVAHDPSFTVWKQYTIKAWPSIIYIDPEGYIVGVLRGEGKAKQLDKMIQQSIQVAEAKKILRTEKIPTRTKPEPDLELKFPGKVYAGKDRLFISDSGHNRIIECMPNGRVAHIFGSGAPGLIDGNGAEAAFDNPQGLVQSENFLFVADTDNHVIRRIDLITRDVSTIAGMNQRGKVKNFDVYDDALQVPLNSPMALEYDEGVLYIAMAGSHQIWAMDQNKQTIKVLIGTGVEGLKDNNGQLAMLAQPSGLSIGEDIEKHLFFVDAETSSIRSIRLRDNHVNTIIGEGLFEFGDTDGKKGVAKCQHPLDVSYDPVRKVLWVADTYNHRLRRLKIINGVLQSVRLKDELHEPGGLSVKGNMLYIADTNAHRVCSVDLNSGLMQEVEIFEVESH